jgi:hypothetical protein
VTDPDFCEELVNSLTASNNEFGVSSPDRLDEIKQRLHMSSQASSPVFSKEHRNSTI